MDMLNLYLWPIEKLDNDEKRDWKFHYMNPENANAHLECMARIHCIMDRLELQDEISKSQREKELDDIENFSQYFGKLYLLCL